MLAWTHALFLQVTQTPQLVSSLFLSLSKRHLDQQAHKCRVSLQLPHDVASGTGKAWWVKPCIHWLGAVRHGYPVNQTVDACYFRCISLMRAVAGVERAGLYSCSCWHASRMGAWFFIPSRQRVLSLQHTSQLVQIYCVFAVCCHRCNHLLIEKCFIAACFCLCFPSNMQHAMVTWRVRRSKSQKRCLEIDVCFVSDGHLYLAFSLQTSV